MTDDQTAGSPGPTTPDAAAHSPTAPGTPGTGAATTGAGAADPEVTRRVMIDHVDLLVADLERSRAFYRAALAPLGMEEHDRSETLSVYGPVGDAGSADFAIDLVGPGDHPTRDAHVAFVATSREMVDAFHAAALRAGGRDKQPPAEHPEYHEGYYGAFVWDPDGNNVEAVFHDRPVPGSPVADRD